MSSRIVQPALILIGATLAAPSGFAQGSPQEWTLEARELVVTNLVGQVSIRGHDGDRVIVRARPGGRDGDRIAFEAEPGDRAEFHAIFPLSESRRYTYPQMRNSRTTFSVESWRRESPMLGRILSELYGRDKVEVTGRSGGGALEAWADLEVLVPAGVPTRVRIGVGETEAVDVRAALDLDSNGGSVQVRNVEGDTRVDTGSGRVEAMTVRGSLDIDTGSGSVTARDIEGENVRIDTGSGGVSVEGIQTRKLLIDTGSGSVRTADVTADETLVDTGSGSVTLDLVRLNGGTHVIDTGSGSVTLLIPTDASARIRAETGSGSIDLDAPSAVRLHRMSRDEVELEIGDAAARVQIDTGSGGVRIRGRG